MTLSQSLIRSALQHIDSPDVIGVGSYARGQETRYSDVDLDIFVRRLPENPYDRYTLRLENHRAIVDRTLSLIKEAGYS